MFGMSLTAKVLLGTFFASVFLVACQYDPDANTYVTSKPAESDIVGTYQFDRQYVDRAATIPGSPTIVLSPNHTCQVIGFPDFVPGTALATWKLSGTHSAKSTWSIDTVGGLGDGSGGEKHIYGLRFSGDSKLDYCALTLVSGKRGLCFGYGDPDSGDSMTFNKIK